jgi:hypothetical protein
VPQRRGGDSGRVRTVISGKKVILWMIAILIVFSIAFLTANAMLVRTKADVCRGYYDATARADCYATATIGPPPDMIKYH